MLTEKKAKVLECFGGLYTENGGKRSMFSIPVSISFANMVANSKEITSTLINMPYE